MVGSGQRGIPLTGDVMCGGYRYNRLFIFYGTFHTSGFRIIAPRAPALNLLTARGGRERKLRSKNIETVRWGGMNRKVGSMVCRTS